MEKAASCEVSILGMRYEALGFPIKKKPTSVGANKKNTAGDKTIHRGGIHSALFQSAPTKRTPQVTKQFIGAEFIPPFFSRRKQKEHRR